MGVNLSSKITSVLSRATGEIFSSDKMLNTPVFFDMKISQSLSLLRNDRNFIIVSVYRQDLWNKRHVDGNKFSTPK